MRDWRRPTAIIAGVVLAGVLAGVAVVAVTGPDDTGPPAVAPVRSPEAPAGPVPSGDPSARPIPDPVLDESPVAGNPPSARRTPAKLRGNQAPKPLPGGPRPPGDDPVVVEGIGGLEQQPLPEGVPDQVNFFFGGGPECWDTEGRQRPARIELAAGTVIPSRFLICFRGFRKSRSLKITLTPPGGGQVVSRTLPAVGRDDSQEQGFMYEWPRLPAHRSGQHRITARQGDTVVTKLINVTRPTRPRLWVDRPNFLVTPGTDVHMYYAGFPPDSTVGFHLYVGEGYRATFDVPTDAFGGGHAVLHTGADPPSGCYGISHPALGDSTGDNPPNTENGFCTSGAG